MSVSTSGPRSTRRSTTEWRRRTMCPACLATAALIVAGATSGGGLAAFAMKKLRGTTPSRKTEATMPGHTIVSREKWLEARKAHLAREKEFTRLRDQLSAER